jgi:acetyltransferase-like isoleucine patch superfamily enzyme
VVELGRLLRAARHAFWGVRSALLLIWYRALFKEFSAGRNVRLGRGVFINVIQGTGRIHLGDGVALEKNVQLIGHGELIVGPRGFIGQGSVIVARQRILIGSDALIGEYVTIRDQDHGTARGELAYNQQPLPTNPIEIGTNVWLGSKVTITRGARIGDGCVVGANSVVTRDLPGSTVCVGAPAEPVRKTSTAPIS